jgi:hypothetical protein
MLTRGREVCFGARRKKVVDLLAAERFPDIQLELTLKDAEKEPLLHSALDRNRQPQG